MENVEAAFAFMYPLEWAEFNGQPSRRYDVVAPQEDADADWFAENGFGGELDAEEEKSAIWPELGPFIPGLLPPIPNHQNPSVPLPANTHPLDRLVVDIVADDVAEIAAHV